MTRTYILLFICVVVWGSNFIFGAILVNTFHPVLLTTLRLLFINLFFLAYAIMCKKGLYIEKNEMKGVLLIGVIGVAINQWSFSEKTNLCPTPITKNTPKVAIPPPIT
ncbi:EamA family transporter, partial [Bacillus sp. D-CC]